MSVGRLRANTEAELMTGVSELAETAEKDGSISRVFFAGRTAKTGLIPVSELLTVIIRPGRKKREYARFSKDWPKMFKPISRVSRVPRHLCVALSGVLDGLLYVGTSEILWSEPKPGEQRRPMPLNAIGASWGSTCYDLQEKDLRLARAFNPVKSKRQRVTLMLGRAMFKSRHCSEEPVVEDHLILPRVLASIRVPYHKFTIREDAEDAVDRAERVIRAQADGFRVVDESGASMLLTVLKWANEGIWADEAAAAYTGMYRLCANGSIEGRPEATVGFGGDVDEVEGVPCLAMGRDEVNVFENPTDSINAQMDKLFLGGDGNRYIRFEPAVGHEWVRVRQNQPLWRPLNTPARIWTPRELYNHPSYSDLCMLATMATVEIRGKLVYAPYDLVTGSGVWVDLDSAPRVQLIRHTSGLCHYSNGVRCNLARLDIEAHVKPPKATPKEEPVERAG